jgi:tRNA threonylcarbamoyladenosine biosynthesis protein TsaB
MVRILAFDTSTYRCSVALGDGTRWLECDEELDQRHSERLLPISQGLLAEAGWGMHDLDGIAFGAGPGSFTGVRIACGVAQGLAYGLDRPALPVCTLQAIAQEASRVDGAGAVLACTDARMHEVYAAAYVREGDAWVEIAAPAVLAPLAVRMPDVAASWTGAGSGFAAYPDIAQRLMLAHLRADLGPTGRAVAELALPRLAAGEGVPAERALPLYVRHRVALTSAERAAGARL